jgi:sugar/nucleoside kinase (ribokinase family)
MFREGNLSILVVGSVALDSVQTPFGKRKEVLGGSATFFSLAASFFGKVDIVAVVGEDFPKRFLKLLESRGIGTKGVEIKSGGKTFRWEGRYDYDLNSAKTIATHLNVFKEFRPRVPNTLKCPDVLFLANIDPDLQAKVLAQAGRPKIVACDSMNYWIENKRRALEKLLANIDILLLNDAEARQFSGKSNLMKAARHIVSLGPKSVVIKKGEHGVIYFSRKSHFIAPAYLLEKVYDPTGAGDTFAGGMMGFLSKSGVLNDSNMRKAIIHGQVLASFAVEDFSVNRLLEISASDINKRYEHYKKITRF